MNPHVHTGPAATVTPPPGYLPAANFRAAAFPSAEDGWVAGTTGSACSAVHAHSTGGIIEATADGGARWSMQYQGSDAVLALAFAATSGGWALAVPAAELPACSRPLPAQFRGQVLLATSDGGRRCGIVDPQADGLDSLYFTAAGGWAGTSTCASPSAGAASCRGALLLGDRWSRRGEAEEKGLMVGRVLTAASPRGVEACELRSRRRASQPEASFATPHAGRV